MYECSLWVGYSKSTRLYISSNPPLSTAKFLVLEDFLFSHCWIDFEWDWNSGPIFDCTRDRESRLSDAAEIRD